MRLVCRWLLFAYCYGACAVSAGEAELRLELARAQLAEVDARTVFEQTRQLHEQGVESAFALRRAETEWQRATIATLRARAALANELPSLRIVSAVKARMREGGSTVTVTVEELDRSHDPTIERRYVISVMDDKSIVSQPYQMPISFRGESSARKVLEFRLLTEIDNVSIVVNSGSKREVIPVLLQRSAGEHRLEMTSPNYSQEGSLGEKVEYTVSVDRFASDVEDVELGISGLPAAFSYEWVDAATKAKVRRVRFPDSANTVRLLLNIHLPEEAAEAWFGRVLAFRAVAVDPHESTLPAELPLQLRTVGTARLAVNSANLLVQMSPGETRRIPIYVENTGAADARVVSLVADLPLGFEGRFLPASIPVLSPRGRATMTLIAGVAADAIPGDYTLRVKAMTTSRTSSGSGSEQSFRIELRDSRSALWVTSVIALVLVALAFGAIWMGRSRRH